MGIPVFAGWVVQIDTDDEVVRLYPPSSQSNDWGEIIPIRRNSGLVYVDGMKIGKTQLNSVILDTGLTTGIILSREHYNQLEEAGELQTLREVRLLNAAGVTSDRMGRLAADSSIGSFTHKGLLVESGSITRLGLGYLSRYVVTIDVSNGRLYLRRAKSFSDRRHPEMSGIELALVGDDVSVSFVHQGSPGQEARIQKGDRIITLNGLPTENWQYTAIRDLLRSKPGRLIQLSVMRDGERHDVSFRLKEEFGVNNELPEADKN